MKYFRSTLMFSAGIGLLIVGLVFILYFQLHYGSDPTLVKVTFSLIGLGVPLAVIGVSGMFGYVKYSKITGISGFLLCAIGVLSFTLLYPENWFYPNVSIVATLYALGLVTLFGGLFAEVVERIIETRVERRVEREGDEVEEVKFVEPVAIPEFEISIKDVDVGDVKLSKTLDGRLGKVVKVKDNVDYDASMLNRVKEGKVEVKVKDDEISKISEVLKGMESRMRKD